MELKLVRNGTKKVANKRRRRNTATTVKKVANKRRKRRNGTSLLQAKSAAKKNGMKLVAMKRVSNKRRHHRKHKRNGTIRKVNNGMFGNSKETIVSVVSLLAGLGVTKVESAILTPIAQQALSILGLQNFARPIIEGGMALTVNKWAADAIKKGSGKFVMYGGLAMALMSLAEQFLPSLSTYNPFSSSNGMPLVLSSGNTAVVDAKTAAALAAASGARLSGLMRPRMGTKYTRPRVIY